MTFAELQRGVFDDLQYQAQPKPGVQDRVRRYLNEALERVLRRPRLKSLRVGLMSLTTEPGRGFYVAPPSFDRIDYLVDLTTGRRLEFRTRDWYRGLDPAVMTTGTPSIWIPEGWTPVQQQPRLIAGELRVMAQSDNALDTTQRLRTIVLRGHAGDFRSEVTLQGTTPVAAVQFSPERVQITHLSLDAWCAGLVTITDGGGAIVAYIPTQELSVSNLGFRLYPTPSAAGAYEIEGQYRIPRMTRDEDTPPFPDTYHEMLQCYARGRMYRKDGRLVQSQAEMAEFERFALDLTAHVEYPVNYKPVAGKLSPGHHHHGWSHLGPWYPAD